MRSWQGRTATGLILLAGLGIAAGLKNVSDIVLVVGLLLVLESAPVPLALAVGEETGQYLTTLHYDHGVRIHTGAAVTEIASSGVLLADGTVFPADDVLLAVGSVPNTEWSTGSGLTIHNGLVCDEYCAAAPGVGDVARSGRDPLGSAVAGGE